MASIGTKLVLLQISQISLLHLIYSLTLTETKDVRNLVAKLAPESPMISQNLPCNCEMNNVKNILKSDERYRGNPLIAMRNPRISGRSMEEDPQERRERVNESMARLMQLLTFFGHVDNFFTQKAQGLIKIMGKAVDTDEGEEEEYPARRYRSVRQKQPKIVTTISS